MAAGDSFLEIPQGAQLFAQMLPDAADLPPEQGAAAGDDDGALLPKDFLLRPIRSRPAESAIVQRLNLPQRRVQYILVLGVHQRDNNMVGRVVQFAQILG